MTRGKRLLALLLMLLLLMAVTAAVRHFGAEEESVPEAVKVMTVDVDGVTSLGWRFGETEYLFIRDGRDWVYPADERFPVSTTTMTALLEALNGMTAEKTIDYVTELEEYGLEDPACIIEIGGDEAYTISIGGENAMGGSCYVTLDGNTVHMTDDGILSDFTVELYSMLRQESIPAMNNVTSVTVERAAGDLQLTSDAASWYGNGALLDAELVNDFLTDVRTLYWSGTVTHNADDKELKTYGLIKPRAVLTVVHTETVRTPTDLKDSDGNTIMDTVTEDKSFVLEIGNNSENGVYARLQGSHMVYEITESYANEILNIAYRDLMSAEE